MVIKTTETKIRLGRYAISDDKKKEVVTVTIYELTDEDKYFWCGVEITNKRDDVQRFQLSVNSGKIS